MMVGIIGPNLTHIATRTTIARGTLSRTTRSISRAGSRTRAAMKPGVIMPTLGDGQYDPVVTQR